MSGRVPERGRTPFVSLNEAMALAMSQKEELKAVGCVHSGAVSTSCTAALGVCGCSVLRTAAAASSKFSSLPSAVLRRVLLWMRVRNCVFSV